MEHFFYCCCQVSHRWHRVLSCLYSSGIDTKFIDATIRGTLSFRNASVFSASNRNPRNLQPDTDFVIPFLHAFSILGWNQFLIRGSVESFMYFKLSNNGTRGRGKDARVTLHCTKCNESCTVYRFCLFVSENRARNVLRNLNKHVTIARRELRWSLRIYFDKIRTRFRQLKTRFEKSRKCDISRKKLTFRRGTFYISKP